MFPLFPQVRLSSGFEEKVQRFHRCEAQLASLKVDYAKKKESLNSEQSEELLAIINDCEAKLDALRADISKRTARNGLIALAIVAICIGIILAKIF